MPEPSELFTNVYVKGYGVEVIIIVLYRFSFSYHDLRFGSLWKY